MSATYTDRQTAGYGDKEVNNKSHPTTGPFLRELCEVTSQ